MFNGSPQATNALSPKVQGEVAKLAGAKNQQGQGGFDAAQHAITRLGTQGFGPDGADARNVLAFVASNPAATDGIANAQQLRSAAIQQLQRSAPDLGPTEIKALADTLGNSSPQVGGSAQALLRNLGAGGNQVQQDAVRAELRRVADLGAPAERMDPRDPRREANADGKSAARATDALVQMGPANGRQWSAEDYRWMVKGAGAGGAGDGKVTRDEVLKGLNNQDPAQRELASRALRGAMNDQRAQFSERDRAVQLLSDAGRLTTGDIPSLEPMATFGSKAANQALDGMAATGVDQLRQMAAGQDPSRAKDAQAALISLADGSVSAGDQAKALGIHLPANHSVGHSQRAAESLFDAGAGDEAARATLARVVVGSKDAKPASVSKAIDAVQQNANRGDERTLDALEAAQRNGALGGDVQAKASKALGDAVIAGDKGAGPALAYLRGITEGPFKEGDRLPYQGAVNALRDAGLAGKGEAYTALRDAALNARAHGNPRRDLVNTALGEAALKGGGGPNAAGAIKTLHDLYHHTPDDAAGAKEKGKTLATIGNAGYRLAELKGPDGKPAVGPGDERMTAVRDALRGALVGGKGKEGDPPGLPGGAEQAAREMRKIAPHLKPNDHQALAEKMDPASGLAATQSMFTLSQALPHAKPEDRAAVFDKLRERDSVARLAPKMNEADVGALKMLAASDDPRRIPLHMDDVLQNATDPRAKAAAAMGLVNPERFNALKPDVRERAVDAIRKGGLPEERFALRQTLGYSPVDHPQLVKTAKDFKEAANNGDKRQGVIDGNKGAFDAQLGYVKSQGFKDRLSLEDDKGRKELLNYELSKLPFLNPDANAQIRADVEKSFGKEGLAALDEKPLVAFKQHFERPGPTETRDPILDGLLGLGTEGAVWLKNSAAARRVADLGLVPVLASDLAEKAGKLPPGASKEVLDVSWGLYNATGRGLTPRALTPAEISEAKTIFGNGLDYSKIDIKIGDPGVLGGPKRPFAMPEPDGRTSIYFPSQGGFKDPIEFHKMLHELVHSWQRQQSANYAPKAIAQQKMLGDQQAYNWERSVQKGWENMGPEQQAQFIETAYNAGAFKNPNNLTFVFNGIDYTDQLKDAVAKIRAGVGAP